MKILGIDPGTTRIGLGLIDIQGSKYLCQNYGLLVEEKLLMSLPLQEKLLCIYNHIFSYLEEFKPHRVGIETLIFAKNVKTVFPVAYARSILLLACAQLNIPVFEPTPMQVKQGVSSQGNANKQQVAFMVKNILNIKQEIKILDDITDALAIAITTANFHNNHLRS